MGYRLAVDLGTTYTGAAAWRDGAAQSVPLGARATAVPSVAFLRADGGFEFGEVAAQRGRSEPEHLAREFKRRIGDPVPISLPGGTFTAEELMGDLLAWSVRLVAEREGGHPDLVALTHPANWGEYRLERLDEVARRAGFSRYLPLSEPEAAAIHYASLSRVEDGSLVAVYDLGGGTFDATLLEKDASRFKVMGEPTGIDKLGGADFDDIVMRLVFEALGDELASLDVEEPATVRDLARLRSECIEAKEYLSSQPDAVVPVNIGDLRTQVRITRAELEARLAPLIDLTVDALERTIVSAGVEPASLRSVLLVGGSSRIPAIAVRIAERLGRPVAVDAHPKDTIALGAARGCGLLDPDGEHLGSTFPIGVDALRSTGPEEPVGRGASPVAAGAVDEAAPVPEATTAAARPTAAGAPSADREQAGGVRAPVAAAEPAAAAQPGAAADAPGAAPGPAAAPRRAPATAPNPPDNGQTRRRRLLAVALTAAALVLVAAVVLVTQRGGSGDAAPPVPTVSVVVPGDQAWVDTGIELGVGDRVQISASGIVLHNSSSASAVGPDGDPSPQPTIYNVVVNGKPLVGGHAGLIARVGDQDPFFVGSAATITASTAGPLRLGINDAGVVGNSGQFDVVMTRLG